MGALKRCVVIGAGVISDFSLTRSFIKEDDFVICADGGLSRAKKMGITPDVLIGDFDSEESPKESPCRKITLNREKDNTDLFEAVSLAYDMRYREILALGTLGGRFDHSLANVSMLSFWSKKGVNITLSDEKNDVSLLQSGNYSLPKKRKYISFFPFGGEVKALTLCGFKYPLSGRDLSADCSLCASNEFTSDFGELSFEKGELLVIFSED